MPSPLRVDLFAQRLPLGVVDDDHVGLAVAVGVGSWRVPGGRSRTRAPSRSGRRRSCPAPGGSRRPCTKRVTTSALAVAVGVPLLAPPSRRPRRRRACRSPCPSPSASLFASTAPSASSLPRTSGLPSKSVSSSNASGLPPAKRTTRSALPSWFLSSSSCVVAPLCVVRAPDLDLAVAVRVREGAGALAGGGDRASTQVSALPSPFVSCSCFSSRPLGVVEVPEVDAAVAVLVELDARELAGREVLDAARGGPCPSGRRACAAAAPLS